MNNVVLDGTLFKDPEIRPVQKTKVANFAILNETGNKTYLIGCEAWGEVANEVQKFSKGDHLAVQGILTQNSWEDKDGARKSIIRIRVNGLSVHKVTPVSEEPITPQNSEPASVGSDSEIPF